MKSQRVAGFATLGLLVLMLAACSGSSEITLRAEPEVKTTDASRPVTTVPKPARSEESTLAKHKLEDRGRTGEAQRHASSPPASLAAGAVPREWRPPAEPRDRENYRHYDDNPVKRVAEAPVSTFSVDVDTGSYSNVRRILNQGRLPARDAVRIEEMINYFSYDYPLPKDKSQPFSVTTEIAPTPWNPNTHLLRIGLKGYDVAPDKLPPANLVFLVDISGSMHSPDKLPLLKSGLKLLVQKLRAQDRVSLVVYAGSTGVVLEPTPGDQKGRILAALEGLTAGGSTNGGAGIRLAYAMAEQGFIRNGINRVLLATDGDFNVGMVSFEVLKNLVEEKRQTGVSLTTLGFGSGNYNDQLMEQLADVGNGHYAYIDNLNEAHKVLVNEMSATLETIARDVKIQIEFNPAVVAEYRLVGYENRVLRREDFNNDKVDAGDIGAGHTVTALYELSVAGAKGQSIDPLRYGNEKAVHNNSSELAWLRLRYKLPGQETSRLLERPLKIAEIRTPESISTDFRFAAAVAAFGQQLRGGRHTGSLDYDGILRLAQEARGKDAFGYRGEFIALVGLARSLDQGRPVAH